MCAIVEITIDTEEKKKFVMHLLLHTRDKQERFDADDECKLCALLNPYDRARRAGIGA